VNLKTALHAMQRQVLSNKVLYGATCDQVIHSVMADFIHLENAPPLRLVPIAAIATLLADPGALEENCRAHSSIGKVLFRRALGIAANGETRKVLRNGRCLPICDARRLERLENGEERP
jgi:hypothetical protein